jgi:hypothetical protein
VARRKRRTGLPVVYAKGDGGLLLRGTRWEPRRVLCTRSAHPSGATVEYVVKYRRPGPVGAAALISEVMCHALLTDLQLGTLEPALVVVSRAVARLYRERHFTDYEVQEGAHFGTVYRPDLEPADPRAWTATFAEYLVDPTDLVALWAADSWFMNLDRVVFGNILLEVNPQGKVHLIAADQSDCFLGASALADGSYLARSRQHGAAPYLPLLEKILLQGGTERLRHIIERIQEMEESVQKAVQLVPAEWWRHASVSPRAIADCLLERANRVERIVELAKWEELGRAIEGGHRIDL